MSRDEKIMEELKVRIGRTIKHTWHDGILYAQNENTMEYVDVTDIIMDFIFREYE